VESYVRPSSPVIATSISRAELQVRICWNCVQLIQKKPSRFEEAFDSKRSEQGSLAMRILDFEDVDPYLLVRGYTDWVRKYLRNGWTAFYVNFMFRPLAGNSESVLAQMRKGIEKGFYGQFCGRFARRPTSPSAQRHLPRLLAYPDRPVWKHDKVSLRAISLNDGLHYNGFMLIRLNSRFREDPISHIHEHQHRYARKGLSRIHVQRTDQETDALADYSLKSVKRDPGLEEHILVLPRPISDFRRNEPVLDPRGRAVRDLMSSLNVCPETAAAILDGRISPPHTKLSP
jgi:hypothetical protein